MYPANHYMDPYHSHYRNHSPYPYYPPHGWEIPPGHPRPMESSYRPATYGPCPYEAGMHRPHPSEFHCCCNRTYPPDYYSFRPPLPQELPPSHLYYHGPFPQHSNTCPSYFVPPPPYPVDQMPYCYDKLKSHCCGCPNHVCHGTEKSNVKIEEEKPDVKLGSEYKDADSGSIIRHPNNQYPFVWVPSSNMEGKENGKCYELSPQLLKEWAPMSRKMTGDVKKQNQDNQFLNEWAPVNSKNTADVMHQEQGNQKEKQFHWPIVWMPAGYDEPKQKAKEMKKIEETPNNSEEAPQSPKIKIIPLSWFENGHRDQKPATRDGPGDHGDRSATKSKPAVTEHRDGMTLEGSPKTTPVVPKRVNNESKPAKENYKTIPVTSENKIDEKKANTYRTIPVTKESDEKKTGMSEKGETKKASNADKLEENGKTKHSESSTAKHSKLPPVCLRVDPFPRKKSGNGSSRSPSPPTRKDGDKAKKDVKEAAQGQKIEPKQSDTRHINVSEAKEKSPNEMGKGMWFSNETVQTASVEHPREEEVSTSKDEQKVQAGTTIGTQESAGAKSLQGGAMQEKENTGSESFKGCDKSKNEDEAVTGSEAANDDAKTCKANLSEPDAAVRIQSAYRGYDVRRWQPLDKLRKIRNVHEQMQGVKKQLQCLEDSCKKPAEKEQVAIGETIMNLLLKLDTIQGLHPSVREARKSVARELVCLQEKLDTLCKQQSGEFDHTNSHEEKSERTENIIQIVSPTVTAEACDKEERAVELGVEEASSVDMEPYNAVPSGIPMEVKQDADASKQKNEKEESCVTTMEEASEQGKAAGQFEVHVPPLMDTSSDAALPEHPTDNQEHKIEESNDVSVEQVCEKSEVEGEEKELMLHDAAATGDSSGLKTYTASTEQSLHAEAESNTGLSYDSTEDIKASATAASVESGLANKNDGPVNGQDHRTAAVESLELRHDVSPAEEDQQRELSGSVVHLEDSSVEQHDLIPADDSVMSDTKDQLEEARDFSIQEQAVDTMEDSTEEQDGKLEDSVKSMEFTLSGNAENPDQPALLEPVLQSDLAPEETVVGESDDAVQCVVSSKDKPPHEDEETKATIDKLTGGLANDGGSFPGTSRKEPDIQENHPNLAGEVECTRDEIAFPELDSFELSCAHEGGITGHERSEMEVSSECQMEAQKEHEDMAVSNTEECVETLKEAAVDASTANSAEDVGVQVSLTEECTEMPENSAEGVGVQVSVTETGMPENAQVGVLGANSAEDVGVQVYVAEKCTEGAVGANLAEEEPGKPKEDISVQTENKTSEEAISAGASAPNDLTNSDEKKKKLAEENRLAEENQQLKELLQKLLASGNDQMGVITDLSEKVKALEHKLARKKRSKVRVHRPSRHVAAKVH